MEEKRRTIVGGRSRGNRLLGNFPRSIEILLKKAKVDEAFRECVLRDPLAAAASIELELSEQEIITLKNIPQSMLITIIENTPVPKQYVTTFRTAQKAAVLVLLLGTTAVIPAVTATGVEEGPTFSAEQFDVARERMAAVQAALEVYKSEQGRYPTTEEWQENINPLSGYVPNSDLYDPWHRKFHYEDYKEGGAVVNYRLESIGLDINSPVDNIPCPTDTGMHLFLQDSPIRIIYPGEDTAVPAGSTVQFQAEHKNPKVLVDWYLDDEKIGQTAGAAMISTALTPGLHKLLLVDENNYRTSLSFTAAEGKH